MRNIAVSFMCVKELGAQLKAQQKVNETVHLPDGIRWAGNGELKTATLQKTLAGLVPIVYW